MANTFYPASPSLPGPVTSPGGHLASTFPSIPLQQLPSSPATSSTVSEQTKRDAAWKYEGYQAFSAWMASEDDFFVFRRFQNLNAQTILWMQDRISGIEERLNAIHKGIESAPTDSKWKNCSFRWDQQYVRERHTLMEELSRLLHQYNEYIEAFSKVRSRPRAESRQISNVVNWLKREAIAERETAFIGYTGDLISIGQRPTRPPLGKWIEACQKLHLSRFFRAKNVPDVHRASASTTYSSNTTFERFTTFSIIITGLVMLLSPMWWLEYVSSKETRLKVITGFVCVFIGMMSMATVNRPFEVVAATAAYAAVLMVFMQIDWVS